MGTEVVSAADGSLAALLGASPGASTAVTIMLEVLERCWKDRLLSESWQKKLQKLFPSYGKDLTKNPKQLNLIRDRNNRILNLG